MDFINQINSDLKTALKARDAERVGLLRMLNAAFQNEAINLKKKEIGLNTAEALAVLKREVKKRKDSVKQFSQGNRPKLAAKEKAEIEIIQKYLPEEMNADAIRKVITEVIATQGETGPSQFGQIMSAVMAKLKGQADGNLVSKLVKEEING